MTQNDTVPLPREFEAEIPEPRKRRWFWKLLIAVAVVAVLAAGGELALRAIIPQIIADTIRTQVGLPETHPIDVELHDSALLPALTGRVGHVSIEVPNVTVFEGIEATLRANADSIPFDPQRGEIVGATASVSIPENSLGAVIDLASSGFANTGEIVGDELLVGRTIEIFGLDVEISATMRVSVDAGDIVIEPTSLNAAGFNLTTEQLRPLLGPDAGAMLDLHQLCVRDQIPAGITLTDLTVSTAALGNARVTVFASLDDDVLSNPAKQEFGSCASEN